MSYSDSSPVAAILNRLHFNLVDKKLSFADFLKLIGLEYDKETRIYRIKINPLDDLQRYVKELSVNDQLVLINEIMTQFIRCEEKWDKTTPPEQQRESKIGHASHTGEIATEVEEKREITLLQKNHSEFEEEFKEKESELGKELCYEEINKTYLELDEKHQILEKHYTTLKREYMELAEENKKLKKLVLQLQQKVKETETCSPPKPTSAKKAHRVAMIVRPRNMFKFVRVQEESLRKSLLPFIPERENADGIKITEEDFIKKFVKIWENPPHAVDTVDNVIMFLKDNHYEAGNLEVRWNKSRRKLECIVEAFLNLGAGGTEAAKQILQAPDE